MVYISFSLLSMGYISKKMHTHGYYRVKIHHLSPYPLILGATWKGESNSKSLTYTCPTDRMLVDYYYYILFSQCFFLER